MVALDARTGKIWRILAEQKEGDIAQVFAHRFRTLLDLHSHQVHAVAFENVKVQWRALDDPTKQAIGDRFEPWQKVPGATGELK